MGAGASGPLACDSVGFRSAADSGRGIALYRTGAARDCVVGGQPSAHVFAGRLPKRDGFARGGGAVKERGVTLIELLSAVTLVALLSVGMLFAMRVGLNAMEKSNATLMANRRVASVQRILEGQVTNIMPVTALCNPGGEAAPSRISF